MVSKEENNFFKSCPKRRGRYINPHVRTIKRSLFDVILWQIGVYNDVFFPTKIPEDFSYPNPKETLDASKPSVMWVNHSTFFVQYQGITILTDPIWSERCSPFVFFGPRRLHHPPCTVEELPKIDIVALSHDHYDHFDNKSIQEIYKKNSQAIFLVPDGVKQRLLNLGIVNVYEHSWWESSALHFIKDDIVKVKWTFVPSQHFSGRGVFDKNKTLWGGWVLEFFHQDVLQKRLYFVGDTGYNPYDFVNIGKHFGEFDLSLIPIGTYLPHLFMAPVHIGPKQAVKIHKEVKSKLSVGMHWQTFKLSSEGQQRPPYDLFLAMEKQKLDPLSFRVLDPGQTINW